MSEYQNAHCVKEGNCFDLNGNTLKVCPIARERQKYYDVTPLIPAEKLCLSGLGAVRESRAKPLLVDSLANISYDIDRAIAMPSVVWDESGSLERDNRRAKKDIMSQVLITLHKSQTRRLEDLTENPHLPIALQLRRLAIFMPAFRTRVEGVALTKELINQTHNGLCGYIQDLEKFMHSVPKNHDIKKRIASHKSESEVMALLTRLHDPFFFPYPAIAREEASHARPRYNHDFYTLGRDTKRAYQVKTSSQGNGYDGEVAIIKHYDILRALKRGPTTHNVQWNPNNGHEDFEWPNPYTYAQILSGDAPDPLSLLLHEEVTMGNRLPKDKKNALQLASSYVVSRIT